jgi:hypothetical protein
MKTNNAYQIRMLIAVLLFFLGGRQAFATQSAVNLSKFGKGLSPWITTGDAWGLVSTPRLGLQVGKRPESQAGGEAATGAIRSPNFKVNGDLIRFLANGWDGHYGGLGLNGFFLKSASDGQILRQAAPPGQDGFEPVTWFVSDLRGRNVYFEAIDRDNNENGAGPGFAWLGFANLQMLSLAIPSTKSNLYEVPLPSLKNTWRILNHDGAGRYTAPYLSSLGFGEPGIGTITSPKFLIQGAAIQLTLCGWSGRDGNRHASKAELIDANTHKILREAPPPLTDTLTPVDWDVSGLHNRLVKVRLVDQDSSTSFAWMGLGMVDARPSYYVNFAHDQKDMAGWLPEQESPVRFCQSAGIPFQCMDGVLVQSGESRTIPLGIRAREIYLAGFTGTYDQGEPVWGDPNDWRHRLFIGDRLGELTVDYADGSSVRYPLIYGYSAWWYRPQVDAPEPFASSKSARDILAETLALRPTDGGATGAFMGVLKPRPFTIKDIQITDNPDKEGVPVISGITVESSGKIPEGFNPLPHDISSASALQWISTHPLLPDADKLSGVQAALNKLRKLLYTTITSLPEHLAVDIPGGYAGPSVRFRGNIYADILTSVFCNDVQDILNKIGKDGMYHTSTPDAPSWGGYTGIGTWQKHAGAYANQSWGRDLGRSLQEITELGYLDPASRCADYCFRESRLWAENPSLVYKGVQIPPHWSRILNLPSPILGDGVFENDAQGLIMLFTWKLWQREPDPDGWLRAHWEDIQAAGDWVQWQFDHPAISGATDVLQTDSECAGGIGNAKYADFLCEEALRAYAQMAESIGESSASDRWWQTADHLLSGIEKEYFATDPDGGPTWTLLPAGWPNRSTNMGPLITIADRRGYSPHDNPPEWQIRDLNAYHRLTSSYHPFGFYGVAMGYGQGFVTQSALLLDNMHDATVMLNWMAKAIYYPGHKPFITPEGCEVDESGNFWHRTGDLGNGVQEGETVKALRIVIGVDDNHPELTQLIPRLPDGWSEIQIKKYPLLTTEAAGIRVIRHVQYDLQRAGSQMTMQFHSDGPIAQMAIRLGPLPSSTIHVEMNGHKETAHMVNSGDSFWVEIPAMQKVEQFKIQANW